jgi:hypothetical protein
MGKHQSAWPGWGSVVSLLNKSEAWSLELSRKNGAVKMPDGTVLKWEQSQNSALDTDFIHNGKGVGNIIARKTTQKFLISWILPLRFAPFIQRLSYIRTVSSAIWLTYRSWP